jgi:50S ribosomal protein L16 3-hydroxylase
VAGLACDELAESRLVTGVYPAHDWRLQYGPFEESDLIQLPESSWTLLVQDVEKHYPPLRRLFDAFSFLPRWRIDDLMISVAGAEGSVGPHVDQYDVFLLQASGRRSWAIAENFDPGLLPDCELNVLRHFDSEREWILEPGDMLYLPPGVAHHGVALETGMTWSIGTRAPSQADLLQALGEWLADRHAEGGRYSDDFSAANNPGGESAFLDDATANRFREFCSAALEKPAEFTPFLGAFLSGYRLAHQPAGPERALEPYELEKDLAAGARLQQNPWGRMLWTRTKLGNLLFASGAVIPCPGELASTVCDPERLAALDAPPGLEAAELLCRLVNDGHLYLSAG